MTLRIVFREDKAKKEQEEEKEEATAAVEGRRSSLICHKPRLINDAQIDQKIMAQFKSGEVGTGRDVVVGVVVPTPSLSFGGLKPTSYY
mmetsp:Transcript_86221/g.180393  ORF Transcript_86221/g.180393 Transcript_86221/m.180393 type:complete len:89 (+) Transcript_86221:336-602(+)